MSQKFCTVLGVGVGIAIGIERRAMRFRSDEDPSAGYIVREQPDGVEPCRIDTDSDPDASRIRSTRSARR